MSSICRTQYVTETEPGDLRQDRRRLPNYGSPTIPQIADVYSPAGHDHGRRLRTIITNCKSSSELSFSSLAVSLSVGVEPVGGGPTFRRGQCLPTSIKDAATGTKDDATQRHKTNVKTYFRAMKNSNVFLPVAVETLKKPSCFMQLMTRRRAFCLLYSTLYAESRNEATCPS